MSDDFIPMDWTVEPGPQPGLYEATIVKVESKKEGQPLRSQKGDLMMKLTFRTENGSTVEDYLMLQGKGREFGARKLEALGIARETQFTARDLDGRRVQLDCYIETYTDKKGQRRDNLKAKEYIPLVGGAAPAAKSDDDTPF